MFDARRLYGSTAANRRVQHVVRLANRAQYQELSTNVSSVIGFRARLAFGQVGPGSCPFPCACRSSGLPRLVESHIVRQAARESSSAGTGTMRTPRNARIGMGQPQ